MTGCTLLTDPAITVPMLTDGSGGASLPIPIPTAGASGVGVAMQWIYFDPAMPNPLGLLSTNGRLVHIGPLICPNRYVYDLFNVNSLTGTVQAGGPIAQVFTVP